MSSTIRSKLILFTVMPVVAVYLLLFWLSLARITGNLEDDAQQLLGEHARHQAARLALLVAQVPTLADSLGDLVLAEPGKPQALLYAHLIDGLRRTPIARSAALAVTNPDRGALMRRGNPAGEAITIDGSTETASGWRAHREFLAFTRAIYRAGERIGSARVEVAIADLYRELARQQGHDITLLLRGADGRLLPPFGAAADVRRLASAVDVAIDSDHIETIGDDNGLQYWVISTPLPGFPWRIDAVTPRDAVLAPVRREALLVAGLLLMSLLAVIAIINVAARRITHPLQALDDDVQRISRGEFSVRPSTAGNDEIGRLASAIRRMAGQVADREQQLRTAQQTLEQRVVARTAELEQSNLRLQQQVEETRRTRDALEQAKDQAQQASRAKSEFLSNMSHELRTPLHGVLGYTQILRREPTTGDAQRESLDAIERCGQHLLTLINDILDLTKIEAGQMHADPQPTGLRQLIADVQLIVAQRATDKGLELVVDIGPDVPDGILTDPVKLKQILLNLLGNAVKFTDTGRVTLAVTRADDDLRFEVGDTGIGIEADKTEVIFDAFNQAREGKVIDGTGLGLAINQRLIRLLGGDALAVESEPGVGSRFRFRIPLSALPPGSLPAPPRETSPPRPPACRVMVVDAAEENRRLLRAQLRASGCNVDTTDDLDDALHRLQREPFDLVLLDVHFPDEGAMEITSEIQLAAAGSPRLVAVSGDVFGDGAKQAQRAGFDAFLARPFSEQEMLQLFSALLDRGETATPPAEAVARLHAGWPQALADSTAERLHEAAELGDVASLFQLAEELGDDPSAPAADVDQLALMARLFDFDGLQRMAERLRAVG